MSRYFAFALALSIMATAQGQTPADQQQQAIIVEGKAVSSTTGEKLRKVNLRLMPASVSPGGMPNGGAGTTTDAEGNFRIEGATPGSYRLMAEKPGYLTGQYGARREYQSGMILKLVAGQKMTGLTLTLVPEARVTGRVLDQDGDPEGRSFVQVVRERWVQGKRQLTIQAGTSADSNGDYKLGPLPAGRYWIVATPSPSMLTANPVARAASAPAGDENEVMTFYPSSLDKEGATALDVQPGKDINGIDVRLRKARTYRVRGKLVGHDGTGLRVMLAARERLSLGGGGNSAVIRDNGAFEVDRVRPGAYQLVVARAQGMYQPVGMTSVEVGDGDVDNVTVQYQEPQAVSGQIRVEGETKDVKLAVMQVFLTSDGAARYVQPGRVKDDGTFSLEGLNAGKYRIFLSAGNNGGYLKSLRWGDSESPDNLLDLSAGVGTGPLVLTYSTNGGQVTGTLKTDNKPPTPQAAAPTAPPAASMGTIILAPEPPNPENQMLYRVVTPDQTGQFTITGIKPGQYKLYAWEDVDANDTYDPEFEKKFDAQSVRVTITEKGSEAVTLPLIPVEKISEAKAVLGH